MIKMIKKKILVFGNALVKEDSLPLRLLQKLRQAFKEIEFKELDSTEDLQHEGRNLAILDSAAGITKVQMISSIDSIKLNKRYSIHDFDLGYNLRLLKKAGLIDSVRIIAVPIDMNKNEAFIQIQLILRKWVAQDMQGS